MQFQTSLLAVLASLAAMTSAMPAPVQGNGAYYPFSRFRWAKLTINIAGGMSRVNHGKRIPCPEASDKAPSAEYKRDTTSAEEGDEDALGDDRPGLIVACAF
jgi:hypothetical protein